LCEQAPVVGGKLGWHAEAGFGFDTGPSLLTLPHLLREVFEDTGVDFELELRPVEPLARYRFVGGETVEVGTDSVQRTAALDTALGPGAGASWSALLDYGERLWQATREPFLERPLAGVLTLGRLALARPRDVRLVSPWRSLRDVGRALLPDPRLRQLLDRYATYSGSDPRRAPAALAAIPYAEQAFGAWSVPGGLSRIAEALRACAEERGVAVRTGADVVEVVLDAGRVSGVVLAGGERLPCDVAVSDVDAADLYHRLVPGGAAARAAVRLGRVTSSYSGFVLLLGVRGRTPGLAHHTVLFPGDYDAEFDAVFAGRPASDPTVYVCAPDDPAVAPPGHEAWFVLVNAPRQGRGPGATDWDAPGAAEGYAEHVLDLLAARGMPVRDRVVLRAVRTPADLARDTRAVGGSIYGTSSNGPRAAFLRPGNRSPVPGLFLVGGSAHPGGGLPLVLLGAQIVAGLVGPAR
ncbi:MAG: phytoene desaturase family protein, partial [Mycobacteriales bacterium]